MTVPPLPGDETAMTELTIAPDGRVFAFGTSRSVLELLAALQPRDPRVRALLAHANRVQTAATKGGERREDNS